MAGDWLKIEIATPDKPEVWQIAAQLNLDADAVVGKLLRVWAWFDQQTENGNAPSVTQALLDRVVGVVGFCGAMVAVGWMIDDGETISLPNFDRHNGETAKRRALTAKRAAKHRSKSNADSNADGVTNGAPREEKRRKDIRGVPRHQAKATAKPEYSEAFERFWQLYPSRKGRKRTKPDSHAIWLKLSAEDQAALLDATKNYAAEKQAADEHPVDCCRFLRDGKWREFIDPSDSGDGGLFDIPAPTIAESNGHERRQSA